MPSFESGLRGHKRIARFAGWSLFALGLTTGFSSAVGYMITSDCASAASSANACIDPLINYADKTAVDAAYNRLTDFGVESAGVATIGLVTALLARRSGEGGPPDPVREPVPEGVAAVVQLDDWRRGQQLPSGASEGEGLAA